jgi:hypothetical protein
VRGGMFDAGAAEVIVADTIGAANPVAGQARCC